MGPEPSIAAPGRLTLIILLLLSLSGSSGCTVVGAIQDYVAYNDNSNDFVMGWRNSVWAREAWHREKYQYAGHPQLHAFGEGFRAGYIAVASGGNGCPPALPPRWYWSWRYQNPEGQAQVAAWYEGFPYGARAADLDGAGLYQQIQVSGPMQKQYTPEYLDPSLPAAYATPVSPTPATPPGTIIEQLGPPLNLPADPRAPILGPAGEPLGSRTAPPGAVAPASYQFPAGTNAPPPSRLPAERPPINPFEPRGPRNLSAAPGAAYQPGGGNFIANPEWFRSSTAAGNVYDPAVLSPLLCLAPEPTSWPDR
jgi:hypothetical protein